MKKLRHKRHPCVQEMVQIKTHVLKILFERSFQGWISKPRFEGSKILARSYSAAWHVRTAEAYKTPLHANKYPCGLKKCPMPLARKQVKAYKAPLLTRNDQELESCISNRLWKEQVQGCILQKIDRKMPSAITKGAKKVQNVNNSAPNTWGLDIFRECLK